MLAKNTLKMPYKISLLYPTWRISITLVKIAAFSDITQFWSSSATK